MKKYFFILNTIYLLIILLNCNSAQEIEWQESFKTGMHIELEVEDIINNADYHNEEILLIIDIIESRLINIGIKENEMIIKHIENGKIIIQLPLMKYSERVTKLASCNLQINFHLIDKEATINLEKYKAQHPNDFLATTESAELLQLKDPSVLPPDTILIGIYRKDENGRDKRVAFTVIKKEAVLKGKAIQSAYIETDSLTAKPIIVFILGDYSEEDGTIVNGAEEFYKVTDAYVGEALAFVIDNRIISHSIARIAEPIRGGKVSIRGDFTEEEAQDLVIALNNKRFPLPLKIISVKQLSEDLWLGKKAE